MVRDRSLDWRHPGSDSFRGSGYADPIGFDDQVHAIRSLVTRRRGDACEVWARYEA